MSNHSRILRDPAVREGKPVIRETWIAVEDVLAQLAAGESVADLLAAYPLLTREDLQECFRWALAALQTVQHHDLKWREEGVAPGKFGRDP
jgi:uncharacterized protein (DUF433 family)